MIRSRSDSGASTGSSSEDDIPLEEKRQAIKDAAQMVFEVDEERGISPPPDWMSQKQTPSKAEVLRKDSDDVSESPLLEEERVAVGEGNIPRKKRKAVGDADGGEILPVNYALTLPERLPKNHLLLELDDNERGAGDLSGDTGVIGRFVQEPGEDGSMQTLLDWKGSIYKAVVLPCAHSVFVVHVQGAEAKIEDCFSSFMAVEEVQQERPSQRGNYILYDSDDNYLSENEDGGGKGKEAAKVKSKVATKAAPKAAAKARKKPAAKKGTKKAAKK